MVRGLWGKKIGMTQVFSGEKVVPVTAIDVSNWYVTQVKTVEKDGYSALKMGHLKNKYSGQEFSIDWIKEPRIYFSEFKEVNLSDKASQKIGDKADLTVLSVGENVDAFGISKGAGFQGVVKRHGFAGGRASHGATFGRFTGSLSYMRSRGRVPKGKKMPGHMGTEKNVMQNLEIMRIEPAADIILVKGSVPGKSGSLIFLKKALKSIKEING